MGATTHKIYRNLDINGDGSGNKNANGDYSNGTGSGVEHFYFEATGYCEIHRMIIHYEDTSSMQAQEYGNFGNELPVGILVKVLDSDLTELIDLTDNIYIQTNSDWARICYDATLFTWGAGNEAIGVRWTFNKSGSPISLSKGQRLVVILNDDFSGLVHQYFQIQGEYSRVDA